MQNVVGVAAPVVAHEVDAPELPHATDRRLVSLDAFRGLTIAAMILVTDPGTYSAVYWPLLHASWDGVTPTDMIFPSFLVISGVAMTLSFGSRLPGGKSRGQLLLHAFRRSCILFLLGLLINGFPEYQLQTIRIPGILQRIAVCYFAGSALYLGFGGALRRGRRSAAIAGMIAILLAGYWALLKLVPVPGFGAGRLDSYGSLPAYVDRSVLSIAHLWPWGLTLGHGVTFDPEGLLSTLPAFATFLIGVLAGEWLATDRVRIKKFAWLTAAGLALMFIGLALNPLLPLNKKIWTSTFAVFSGGIALVLFSALYFVLDVKRWRAWVAPALVFGTNAIFAFALSSVITTLADRIHVSVGASGSRVSLHQWGYQQLFATWLPPVNASLAYAVMIVLLNLVLVYPLYRKRIFLRI
jgi:predicted acyltransferase